MIVRFVFVRQIVRISCCRITSPLTPRGNELPPCPDVSVNASYYNKSNDLKVSCIHFCCRTNGWIMGETGFFRCESLFGLQKTKLRPGPRAVRPSHKNFKKTSCCDRRRTIYAGKKPARENLGRVKRYFDL